MSIRDRLQNNVFHLINALAGRVAHIETQVERLRDEMRKEMRNQRQHMVRLKNREELSDSFLLNGHPYHDLSPENAWRVFEDKNADGLFLDVSHADYRPEGGRPEGVKHIPLEELENRLAELPPHHVPLYLISEDGLRSILACEYLNQVERPLCNNVSGGWKFWVGFRRADVSA